MTDKDLIIPPGETVKELMQQYNVTSKNLASKLNMSQAEFKQFLDGDPKINKITKEIATTLSEVFNGIPGRFWLKLDNNYREELKAYAEENQKKES